MVWETTKLEPACWLAGVVSKWNGSTTLVIEIAACHPHLVQPAGPEDGRVEDVGPVGGGHQEHAAPHLHPVHLRQQLVHHPARRAAIPIAARRSTRTQRVQLVEKDDTGRGVAGALEAGAHRPFALADVHVEQLGALDGDEVDAGLVGDGLGHEGLATPRRTLEITIRRLSPIMMLAAYRVCCSYYGKSLTNKMYR